MAREIKESDWKLFRRLHGIALERFCQRVIEDVRSATVGLALITERLSWGTGSNRLVLDGSHADYDKLV